MKTKEYPSDVPANKKPFKIHIYKDADNKWRWHLKSSNGLIVAESGQGYKDRRDAKEMVTKIWKTAWALAD